MEYENTMNTNSSTLVQLTAPKPFNQFNFNFEVLKLIEEMYHVVGGQMLPLRANIAQNKIIELWDSVEREMLRQLEADEEAEGKRYDI